MKLPSKSNKTTDVDISDYYAIKVGSIWKGLKQEKAAFWWLCIYMFFEYIRPASLYPVIDILPWTQIALIMTVITAILDKDIKWVRNTGNKLLVIYLFIVFLSSLLAFHPATAWDKIYIFINWVIVYFLIITVINNEKKFFLFLLLFLLLNFKMSQHGAYTFAARGFSYTGWGVVGSPGWFRDSGDFGVAMMIFIPLSISFLLAFKRNWGVSKKLFFYLMPLTGLLAVIGTSSRGVQLGLAAIGIWFLLKSRKGLKAAFSILILGWALYSILPEEMLEEYQAAGEDHTSQDRLVHWDFGYEVIRNHPGLGVGYYNWLDFCNYKNPDGLGFNSKCRLPHNTYITAGAETGLVGLTVYIFSIFFIFICNARTRANALRNKNQFVLYVSHGLDGGLVGYLVSSLFFSVLFYPFYWIQLAMSVALYGVSNRLPLLTKDNESIVESNQVDKHIAENYR